MANKKSSLKRVRTTEKSKARNLKRKRVFKQAVKSLNKQVTAEKKDEKAVKDLMIKAYKSLDKAASRGVIHKNKASRLKSRLAKKVNKANVK